MLFKKETLQQLVYDEVDGYKVVEQKLVDHDRWSVQYSMVFKFENKYYKTTYSKGATEYQDEEPYEYAPDEIECKEVIPVSSQTITYV